LYVILLWLGAQDLYYGHVWKIWSFKDRGNKMSSQFRLCSFSVFWGLRSIDNGHILRIWSFKDRDNKMPHLSCSCDSPFSMSRRENWLGWILPLLWTFLFNELQNPIIFYVRDFKLFYIWTNRFLSLIIPISKWISQMMLFKSKIKQLDFLSPPYHMRLEFIQFK
jgi:hypothetical protein